MEGCSTQRILYILVVSNGCKSIDLYKHSGLLRVAKVYPSDSESVHLMCSYIIIISLLWEHVAQWIGCWTQDQDVWDSIPSVGHVYKCQANFVFHTA